MKFMKRNTTALAALILSSLLPLSSCTFVEESSAAPDAEISAAEAVTAETEVSRRETSAAVSKVPLASSPMMPSGEVITVLDETFTGFTDLISQVNGITKNHVNMPEIMELVKCGAIAQKLNPNDPKGMFYPDQTLKAAEAITLAVNAFSETKIPLEDWYNHIHATILEDDYPAIFTNLVFSSKQDFLSEDINLHEFSVLLLYTFEKYTGVTLEPAHNLDKITFEDAYNILRANGILDFGIKQNIETLILRHQAAEYIYNLLQLKNS